MAASKKKEIPAAKEAAKKPATPPKEAALPVVSKPVPVKPAPVPAAPVAPAPKSLKDEGKPWVLKVGEAPKAAPPPPREVLEAKYACSKCGKMVGFYEVSDSSTRKGYCSTNCYIAR